jgi:hypothetical protein
MSSSMLMAEADEHTTYTAQAVRNWGLVRLELSSKQKLEPGDVAPFLTPSLTTLIADVALPQTPEAALLMLPTPLLLITSLDIDIAIVNLPRDSAADASGALAVLAQQLPQLTSLHLRGGGRMPQLLDAAPRPPATALSLLPRLRHLLIGGPALAQSLAPVLSTLPDLTSLGLPGGVLLEDVHWLPPLTRLRRLSLGCCTWGAMFDCELGHRWQDEDPLSFAHMAERRRQDAGIGPHLEALKGMRGLTELVLYLFNEPSLLLPPFESMLPLPAMLRRLVVSDTWMLEAAERALGQHVDEICLLASESCDCGA